MMNLGTATIVSNVIKDLLDDRNGALAVARLALMFGTIRRTAVFHEDQSTRETDAEHTVMLAWLAPSLADLFYPELNASLVAAFAVVHDMPEVFAGDTPTLRITPAQREAKARREADAVTRLGSMFDDTLPWIPDMVRRYEARVEREARFVWAVDKLMPKLVHLIDRGAGLREHRVTAAEFARMVDEQRMTLSRAIPEFSWLLELHTALCDRVTSSTEFAPEV